MFFSDPVNYNNTLMTTEFGNSRCESGIGTRNIDSKLPASCYVYGLLIIINYMYIQACIS